MKLLFEIDLDMINDMQLKTMRETILLAKHAHWTNIKYRIDGKDEYVEADWLKHLVETPNTEQPNAIIE